MAAEEADLSILPPATRALARRIGVDGLQKLVKSYGGVRIYIPARGNLHSRHWLSRCIGLDRARQLADEEGRHIDVPMCKQFITTELHRQIRAYRAEHSERETARQFRVSSVWVRKLMQRGEPLPTPQSDLFEADDG